MNEFKELAEILSQTGIPLLISGLLIYAVWKFLPEVVALWREGEKDKKEYYANRQKQYDEQMQVLIRVAEQGNAVINQNTAAMERNTEVYRQTITSNEEVGKTAKEAIEEIRCLKKLIEREGVSQ